MDTMYTDDMDTQYTPEPEPTDWHGRTSDDFDNDMGPRMKAQARRVNVPAQSSVTLNNVTDYLPRSRA